MSNKNNQKIIIDSKENNSSNEDGVEYRLEPPNGGFGWWVCFGSALIHLFNLSFNTVFGLLFGPFLESMGQNTSGIVLVVNLSSVAVNLSGLVTGIVLKKFSPRQVTIFGSIITGLGLVLCAYAEYYWQILIGYSFMVGLGSGLVHPAAFLALDSFFTTKKTRAMGFSHAGASIGHIIIPNLVTFLLQRYGFRKTVLAKGTLSLCGIIGGAFFQPVEKYMVRVKVEKEKPEKFQYKDFENQTAEKPTPGTPIQTVYKIENDEKKAENFNNGKTVSFDEDVKHSSFCSRLFDLMDLRLLKCPVFLNIAIGIGICFTVTINFALLLPFFLEKNVHLDNQTTAFCISLIASADLVSRITFPFITERFNLTNRTLFLVGAAFMSVIRAVMAEMNDYNMILVTCILFGYFKALMMVNQGLAVSQYCSTQCPNSLAGAIGLLMLIRGLCTITIGQFLGWVRDASNSFSLCLHIQNIFVLLVIILWIGESISRTSRNKVKKTISK